MAAQDLVDRAAAESDQARQPRRPVARPSPRPQDPLLSLGAQPPRTTARPRRPGPQTRQRRPLSLRRRFPAMPPPMRGGRRNRTLSRRGPKRAPTLNQTDQLQPARQSELASTVFHVRPPLEVQSSLTAPSIGGRTIPLSRSPSPQAAQLVRQLGGDGAAVAAAPLGDRIAFDL